jgi:hypothetical protein
MKHLKNFNESFDDPLNDYDGQDPDDDGQWDDEEGLEPVDIDEYPDVMEYLDKTLLIDSNGYTKSKSGDPEIVKQVNLGGIQQVARSKYPQLTQEELNRTSTLWFWHNLPVDMVKKMQNEDPGRFKFMTKFFGDHPKL